MSARVGASNQIEYAFANLVVPLGRDLDEIKHTNTPGVQCVERTRGNDMV